MKQKKLLLLPLLFFCGFVYSQINSSLADETGIWILDKTVNKVAFYHKIEMCNNQKVVFIKLDNRNAYNVDISWNNSFTISTQGNSIDGFKSDYKLRIPKGESFAKNCNDLKFKDLIINAYDVDPARPVEIQSFNVKNMVINKAL
ncbi:MAG: hypothetical protein ABIT81_08235 [Ferruginibacter sp.]